MEALCNSDSMRAIPLLHEGFQCPFGPPLPHRGATATKGRMLSSIAASLSSHSSSFSCRRRHDRRPPHEPERCARDGIITASGFVCGQVIWGALAGLGAALVLSQDPLLYRAVAAAGGFSLTYLAYQTFFSARSTWRSATAVIADAAATATSPRRSTTYFFTGLMTNLLNPRIGVFYRSVMPGLFLGRRSLPGSVHFSARSTPCSASYSSAVSPRSSESPGSA